ncbi:MAG: aminotransferase class IV, partial [bacterium]|nr:aminotransferase class IV [bacterium]
MKVYLNGRFVEERLAKVSVFDRSFLYGDGVFETLRAYCGRVFKEREHLYRLRRSAETIYLQLPTIDYSRIFQKLLKVNNLSNALIRLTISRGEGWGIEPSGTPNITCFAKNFSGLPEEMYKKGISAVVAERRMPNTGIKSTNYLEAILARLEAKGREAIMLIDGFVGSAATSNIFIVKDQRLITPPLSLGILPGITRETVLSVARVEEQVFKKQELYSADEVFLTNTSYEIMPITEIDGRKVGDGLPGVVTKTVLSEFKRVRLLLSRRLKTSLTPCKKR